MAQCGRCIAARKLFNKPEQGECSTVNQIKLHYAKHNRAKAKVESTQGTPE